MASIRRTRMPTLTTDGYALTAAQRARLIEASAALERLRLLRRARIALADCPGFATWAFDSYLQLGLYRIVSLGDGIGDEWNAHRVVNSAILTRSLMETVSAWWHLLDRAIGLVQKDDIRGAHALAMKAMFGTRYRREGEPTFPSATSALTLVQRLDKTFPGTMHFYESICEIVHPNSDSIFLFGDVDQAKVELLPDEHHATKEEIAINKVLFGFVMFEIAEKLLESYQGTTRVQIGALETRFGPRPSSWPGDPDPELPTA